MKKGSNSAKAAYYRTAKIKRPAGGLIKSFAAARYEDKRLGKMGAASEVRKIDPSTVDISKYV